MRKLCTLFILSLEGFFTNLHNNMTDLPDSWETEDLEQLTALACQYLATVVRNRARNKLQQEIVKQENKK